MPPITSPSSRRPTPRRAQLRTAYPSRFRPHLRGLQEREQALALQVEQVSEGLALTVCPDCGSTSATTSEAAANRKLVQLEEQNTALKARLLRVTQAIENLWLYPSDNFPTEDPAADIRLFAHHMEAFTQQVQAKMASLSQSMEKLKPVAP